MNEQDLRARLAAITAATTGDIVHGDDVLSRMESEPIRAAVLVAFVRSDPLGILLTKRTSHLKDHAGQVAFPGGRVDPEDRHFEDAALREAEEEIALHRGNVEVIGRLDDYITGSGYRVTPIVGFVPPGLTYQPSPDEVETVFELSIDVLMDPGAPQRKSHHVRGHWREYWVWPHPEHYIWGATAAILANLAQKLRAAG